MYEWASESFEAAGYLQYEISNWAVDHQSSIENRSPAFACLHNLQYWRGLPYLGFGAGAHGYAEGYRYSNVLRIKTYIDRLSNIKSRVSNIEYPISNFQFPLSPAAVNQHRQTVQDEVSEYMMTGLRLTREGVAALAFVQRFGRDLREVYGNEIDELIRLGLLEWHKETSEAPKSGGTSEVLRLTVRGRLLGNQVFMRFLE
jgi:oxygen-independent coproporphyrinogen-3 oxidase